MVAGLATGMGYISYAILFTAIVCGILVLLERLHFGGKTGQHTEAAHHDPGEPGLLQRL
jgi:hypothetical protein